MRGQRLLQAYIRGVLGRAHYEILEDDGSYYGEVPGFEGVYANAESLEKCREDRGGGFGPIWKVYNRSRQ